MVDEIEEFTFSVLKKQQKINCIDGQRFIKE